LKAYGFRSVLGVYLTQFCVFLLSFVCFSFICFPNAHTGLFALFCDRYKRFEGNWSENEARGREMEQNELTAYMTAARSSALRPAVHNGKSPFSENPKK
jgi:hypothetical protein